VTATSAAEVTLRVARTLTHSQRSAFGCGALVDVVLKSFPRDVEADPWEFNLVLVWWRAHPSLKDIVAKGRSKRSEFVRSLLTRDVGNALDAVRVEPLCRSLWQTFRETDWDLLRQDLELEFEAAAQLHRGASDGKVQEAASTAEAAPDTDAGSAQQTMVGGGRPAPPIPLNLFARLPSGHYLIGFGGKQRTVPMLKGLRLVEYVLKQPGTAAHMLEINRALSEGHPRAAPLEAACARSGESRNLDGFTDAAWWAPEPYSEEALRQAEEAVDGLEARAAESRNRGDCAEAGRLENEAERARELIREHRGQARRLRRGQPGQRAQCERVRVKLIKNFTYACMKLREDYGMPELVAHLEEQIEKGTKWKYRPVPGVEWAFDSNPHLIQFSRL
jgi:hypothetical protein